MGTGEGAAVVEALAAEEDAEEAVGEDAEEAVGEDADERLVARASDDDASPPTRSAGGMRGSAYTSRIHPTAPTRP
ncbi:MAG: hypothetical protein KC468_38940 [Myxococcales bacterium]|nr:hypothetical protein [Myxococcales bacterium]